MLKKSILLLVGTVFLASSHIRAEGANDDEEQTRKSSHALTKSPFEKLPSEMIVYIGQYLFGNDFHRFSSTCVPVRNILIGYTEFFMPEEIEEIKKAIKKTPLKNIPRLILEWSRTPKQISIPQLRLLRNEFSFNSEINADSNEKELNMLKNKFKNYIKILNILYGLGDEKEIDICNEIDRKIQIGLEDTIEYTDEQNFIILRPALRRFYFENLALLSSKHRENLAIKYQKGEMPFEKNEKRGIKLFRPLNLPLF